jgi:hypothetical protein
MLAAAVRNLIGRFAHHPPLEADPAYPPGLAEPSLSPPQSAPQDHVAWPAARLALAHRLWGGGFIFPGGEIETLRLARPLGASAATSLLMVGVGSGGPASVAARNLGTWVTGLEADPSLLAAARVLVKRAQLGKKGQPQGLEPRQSRIRRQKPSPVPGVRAAAGCATGAYPGRSGTGAETRRSTGPDGTGGSSAAASERPDCQTLGHPGGTRSGQRAGWSCRYPHAGAGRDGCAYRRGHLLAPSGTGDAGMADHAARPARNQTVPPGRCAAGCGGRTLAAAPAAHAGRAFADDALARAEPGSDRLMAVLAGAWISRRRCDETANQADLPSVNGLSTA